MIDVTFPCSQTEQFWRRKLRMENKELFILYLSRHLTSLDVFASSFTAVADSRPSDKGGGWRSCIPWDKGEAGLKKKFFSALRASVWSKTKEGPSPRSATVEFTSAQKGSLLICSLDSVADCQGRGSAPLPHLISSRNWGPKGRKKFFWRPHPPPPPYLRVLNDRWINHWDWLVSIV